MFLWEFFKVRWSKYNIRKAQLNAQIKVDFQETFILLSSKTKMTILPFGSSSQPLGNKRAINKDINGKQE